MELLFMLARTGQKTYYMSQRVLKKISVVDRLR